MKKSICIFLIWVSHWSLALAGISLDSTRYIYLGTAKAVDVVISNTASGASRYLAWIDDGDITVLPENASTDFFVFPPSGFLAQGRKQTVRIMYRGPVLPADRETVRYLNVLEIPQKASPKGDQSVIAIANRTRVKIFMRPADMAVEPLAAAKNLVWEAGLSGATQVLKAKNASPYFVSMHTVKLMRDGTELANLGGNMVPPWGELELRPDPKLGDLSGVTAVKYFYVNDFGGDGEVTFTLPAR